MDKKIDEVEFTVFDTETTGLEPESGDRIVEIAAIRFKAGKKIVQFQTLVNPERPVSAGAAAVNRISQEMLEGAPLISAVMPGFLDFIGGSCLCSYNSAFDLGFLNSELKFINRGLNAPALTSLPVIAVADILKMAKRLLPGMERYALWYVAGKLGIESGQQHRALSDCALTLEVFNRLNETLKNKGIIDFGNFLSLFGMASDLVNNINNKKISQIQEAMNLGVNIRIRYLSASTARVSERIVSPKEIRQENGQTYLVGYCHLRDEERSFRIDGALHIEIV